MFWFWVGLVLTTVFMAGVLAGMLFMLLHDRAAASKSERETVRITRKGIAI